MIVLKEKSSDLKPELTLIQNNYNTKFNPDEDIVKEPSPEEAPEDLSVIPLNKATKSFYEYLLGTELEMSKEIEKPICPECNQAIFTATIYKNGYYQDYSECRNCNWNSLKETPAFTPENIEEELLKVPFENCEEVKA